MPRRVSLCYYNFDYCHLALLRCLSVILGKGFYGVRIQLCIESFFRLGFLLFGSGHENGF